MAVRDVVLLLGADLGDPVRQCAAAEHAIGERIAPVTVRSRDHWTQPWGFEADTLFLNRAVLLTTPMPPALLLETCLSIENDMGRKRMADGTVSSRLIDIDILLIGNEVVKTASLVVPHPRLVLRHFALAPLCDLLPAWQHPASGRTALQLLNALPVA